MRVRQSGNTDMYRVTDDEELEIQQAEVTAAERDTAEQSRNKKREKCSNTTEEASLKSGMEKKSIALGN